LKAAWPSMHFAAAIAICLKTLQLFAVCTVHLKAGAAAKQYCCGTWLGAEGKSAAPVSGRNG